MPLHPDKNPDAKTYKDGDWCHIESSASMNCLANNSYNKKACQKFFDEYLECKKELNLLKAERRKQGLDPRPTSPRDRTKVNF